MTTITIVSDEGEELSFDTSGASLCYNNGIASGNYVTIEYTGELNGSDTTGIKVTATYDYADGAAGSADSAGDYGNDTGDYSDDAGDSAADGSADADYSEE